jgi:glycosyltransferase involved in cell wall biosynthesis
MGPVSTVIFELSNHFAALGHEVILADMASAHPRPLLNPAIRVVEVQGIQDGRSETAAADRIHRISAAFRKSRNYWRCLSELQTHLDLSSVNVVHAHSPIPALLLQRLHGIRCFYTAHTPVWSLGSPPEREDASRKPTRRRRPHGILDFDAWAERDVIPRSALTIGLGNYLKSAIPHANIETIASGLNLSDWQPIDRVAARRALGIADTDFVLLFVGRVTHIKGIDVLLAAVKSLAPSIPGLRALVMGPLSGSFDTGDETVTPYARSMIQAARDLPVEFLGFINNRELRCKQYFAAADVFALPSRCEPQGLVVLESLAMGVPVIGSATGGIPEMLSPEVGCVFPAGNAEALAACIRALYEDPRRLNDMRAAARKHVERRYSWERVINCYLSAYARNLGRTLGSD